MCPSTSAKRARLLYFAGLAEALASTSEEVALPAHVKDVETLLGWLRERGGPWQALAPERVQVTVNKQFADPDTPVEGGDEIAFIPKPKA